jgi:hypothetical protein
MDGFAGNAILAVWWRPETNQVRVERPPVYVPPPPSVPAMRYVNTKWGMDSNPIVTQPGFIYTYQGVDYDDDAAARLAIKQGSIDGWTWRKRSHQKLAIRTTPRPGGVIAEAITPSASPGMSVRVPPRRLVSPHRQRSSRSKP